MIAPAQPEIRVKGIRMPAGWRPALAFLLSILAVLLMLGCNGPGGSDSQSSTPALAPDPSGSGPGLSEPFEVSVVVAGVDLTVDTVSAAGVTGNWQSLGISGTVSAVVSNQGSDHAVGTFPIIFFEDTDGDGHYTDGTDNVLGTTTQDGLASGLGVVATAEVSGSVAFRDNLIHAFADADGTIAEVDEANNLDNSGAACEYVPPIGAFDPVVEWHWSGSTVVPDSHQVMMTPAVIDLNGDGVPDVVFSTFIGSNYVTNGLLRAISGVDGSDLWTVTDPAYLVSGAAGVAVGDIDGDGMPEILAGSESQNHLLALEHDGTPKWTSIPIEGGNGVRWGSASLADLDADGTPEIVIGRTVLKNDGTLLWRGAGGMGNNGAGPLSLVADLDSDGQPEIVGGNTAYETDGTTLWTSATGDGFPAVADFDADAQPEVVLVSNGNVYLLNGQTGGTIWSAAIPGGGGGGAPTVADFDGDGAPEVGVAGANNYVVYETDGSILWQNATVDTSSNRTGSSVFDFDGDGSAEVIYGDHHYLRIYRGADGAVLFETPNTSGTTYELPVIADVDADGNAEIVMISNDYPDFGVVHGIRVFGDAADNWVNTRQIWNQHTYHVTNVNDDGTIPAVETNNWDVPGLNNYRLNAQGAHQFAAPDLTASYVRINVIDPTTAEITARIGNGGAQVAAAGLPVSFYDGDPSSGGVLLGTVNTTVALAPGEYEDVTLSVNAETAGTVWVVADDSGGLTGTVNECREDNNAHDSGLRVSFNEPPVCSLAEPSIPFLWPPNKHLVEVTIEGVTNPDGNPVTITIDAITSDEPTAGMSKHRGGWPGWPWRDDDDKHGENGRHSGYAAGGVAPVGATLQHGGGSEWGPKPDWPKKAPDAEGVGTDTARLRAERSEKGDGRVYVIHFTADDGNGGTCSGTVSVGVPRLKHDPAVDSGQDYDATAISYPEPPPRPPHDKDDRDDDRHHDRD